MTPAKLEELLAVFVSESHEHIDLLERSLLALARARPTEDQAQPEPPARAAFRAAHSLAGNASLLGLATIEQLARAAELVLARLRNGERATPAMSDALLGLVGPLRELIAALERDRRLAQADLNTDAALAGLRPWLDR